MSEFKKSTEYSPKELDDFLDELSKARIKIQQLESGLGNMVNHAFENAQTRWENMMGMPIMDTDGEIEVFDKWCDRNFPELQVGAVLDGKKAKDRVKDRFKRN